MVKQGPYTDKGRDTIQDLYTENQVVILSEIDTDSGFSCLIL